MNTNACMVHFRPSRHREPIRECMDGPENEFREVVKPLPSTRPTMRFIDMNADEQELARGMWASAGPNDGCVYFWFGGMLIKNRVGGAA